MSDWQVGDLAVCVDAAPRSCRCGRMHLGLNAPFVTLLKRSKRKAAVEWVLERHDLARQLNEESEHDGD